MDLTKRCQLLLTMSEALVEDRIARGDSPHDALLRVAKDHEEMAKAMKHGSSARSAAIKEMFMTPGTKVTLGAGATFDNSPPRKFKDDLLTVAAIAKLRAAIILHGKDAPRKAIIAEAKIQHSRGNKVL